MYNFEELKNKLHKWSSDKGIDRFENHPKQMMKVIEELGEVNSALLKDNRAELRDGLGDTFVTLIILCDQLNEDPVACLNLAWEEIKDRKGKTVNGSFVRDK